MGSYPTSGTITINASPGTFPVVEMIATGLLANLTPSSVCVLMVVWDYHRRYPDTARPSRETIGASCGLSVRTVTRALEELEQIGLLDIRPSSGPGSNTYRVCWDGLRIDPTKVPDKGSDKGKNPNPYHRDKGAHTILTERGKVVRVAKGHIRDMPDGCVTRSADETTLHSWLEYWGLPHACNVPYADLGILGLSAGSTCDFVLGPRLICEMYYAPATPAQAQRYQRNRARKEAAIRAAGFCVISIESGKFDPFALAQQIVDHWSGSTVAQAEAVYRKAKMDGSRNGGHLRWKRQIEGKGERVPRGPLRYEGAQPYEQTPIVVLGYVVATPAPVVPPATEPKGYASFGFGVNPEPEVEPYPVPAVEPVDLDGALEAVLA